MKQLLVLLGVVLLVACQTVPEEIPEDLSRAELIQLAQEATEAENYGAARAYYQAILDRFQDDRATIAVARYEIGFVEYKAGNLEAAEQELTRLLNLYDFESESLPAWPRVLGQIILDQIRTEDVTAEE